MNREDVADWLDSLDCKQVPIDGFNVTGRSVKYVNPKNGRYVYIDLPIDKTPVPDYAIAHICEQLLITSPDCAVEQKPLVDHFKKRFSPKGK
jgi:hypothetical protein